MKKQWGLLLSPTVFLNTIFGMGAIFETPEKQGCSGVGGVGWLLWEEVSDESPFFPSSFMKKQLSPTVLLNPFFEI